LDDLEVNIVELPRRGGKTTAALKWLHEQGHGALMVVSGYDTAPMVWTLAQRLELTEQRKEDGTITREGIQRRQIVSTFDAQNNRIVLQGATGIVIDDAEQVLYDFFHAPVHMMTVTADHVGGSLTGFPDEMTVPDAPDIYGPYVGQTDEVIVGTDEKVEPL
jgi:hypothetical protein